MFIRVHIVTHRCRLAKRTVQIPQPLGLSVTCPPTRGPFWDRVGDAGDLLIASRSETGSPGHGQLKSLAFVMAGATPFVALSGRDRRPACR